jgi:thymidylate synthase (FAD)
MKFVEPKIFHIAQTTLDINGVDHFLEHLGIPDWTTDAHSDTEELLEIAGRSCYKSFGITLNKNLTKVRDSNSDYISNVINKHDGSVLEHGNDTYAIVNVSRIFTHELVRHRHAAYSQESLRFVRLDDLSVYYPDVFANHPEDETLREAFLDIYEDAENMQKGLAKLLKLDTLDFEHKKLLTSAMRRLAPDGLATMIVMTTNHRNWRWLIEMRTSQYAEEEIRKVFVMIFDDLKSRYPNIYFDSLEEMTNGIRSIKFNNSKV